MARYTLPGVLKVIYWPTVDQPTNLALPTQAQITAGHNLIGTSQGEALSELQGWELDPQVIDTPDYVSLVVGTVPGAVKVPVSKIGLWLDTASTTLYDTIVLNATGVVGFFFNGTAAGKESRLYVVTCISKERTFDQNAGHKAMFGFSASAPVVGAAAA